MTTNSEKWNAAWDAVCSPTARSVASDVAWYAAWDAAQEVAPGVAWEMAWNVAQEAARYVAGFAALAAARGTILALIAYDDCAYMLDSDVGELKIIAAFGDSRAVLLLPACMVFNEMKIA